MKVTSRFPFLNGIIFFVLGLIVFFNPDSIIQFVSYFLGGLLIGLGIYKCSSYYVQNKKTGIVNSNELYFGITVIVLGLVIILLSSAVELLFKLVIGIWLILSGISKIYSTFTSTDRSHKFYTLLIMGVIFIAAGLYTILVSNLAVKLIGLFMAIYGIIEFASFFVYKGTDNKLLKKPEVKEAEYEEK